MMQKLKDLQLYLMGSRKAKVLLAVGIIAGLFLYFNEGKRPTRIVKPTPPQKKGLDNKETATDLITRFNQDLQAMTEKNQRIEENLNAQQKQLQDFEQRTAEILKKMLERIQDNQSDPSAQGGAPVPVALDGQPDAAEPLHQEAELQPFGLEPEEVAPPPPPPVKKVAYIGAGDSVRVKLLAGVNAPTDGTPYPVVFKLVSDVYGPDGSAIPLGEARLVAAAQGSLTDSRALFRLTSMNILLPTGEKKVYNVDGWIVGEDGIRGMRGILIDPIGKAIGGAAFAGGLAAAGQGLATANSTVRRDLAGGITTDVTGSLAQFAAGQAITGAATEWSRTVNQRLQQLIPVVEILSGREGTAVFAQSLPVEGLYEAIESEDDVMASMD